MKKESLIAVFLGIAAGIGIALWVVKGARQSNDNSKKVVDESQITPSITVSNFVTEPLLISSPEDGSVVESDTVTIKGRAPKGSLLIIQSSSDEVIVEHEEENFSEELALTAGANEIVITSYTKNTVPEIKSMIVYYPGEEE